MTKKKEETQVDEKSHDYLEMTEKEKQEHANEYHHQVDISTVWDSFSGEMVMDDGRKKYDAYIFSFSLGDFDDWDHISKIDYLTDLRHFVQLKIDEVHDSVTDFESAVLVDMMGAPEKSNGQRYLSTGEKEKIQKAQVDMLGGITKKNVH